MRYRELLKSYLDGEILPFSPVSAWQHEPIIDQSIEKFATTTLGKFYRYDFDFLKLTPASTWQSIDHGLIDHWNHDFLGRREIVRHNITEPYQLGEIKSLDPWKGFTSNILNVARILKQNLPAHVPLLVTVFNPFFQAVQQAGLSFIKQIALEMPAFLQHGLDVLLDNTLKLISQFAEIGVDGVFYVTQHASRDQVGLDFYKQWVLPADLACISAISEMPFSMLHLHGNNTYWSLFSDISITIHCDKMDVEEVKDFASHTQRISGTLCNNDLFVHGDPYHVANAVLTRRELLKNSIYISTPGCALPLSVPAANIDALVNAARQPLAYGINR